MDTERIQAHADALRTALKAGDKATGLPHQARLTEAAARALLDQDAEAMRILRTHFAGLAVLADRYGWDGPGQRWWALDEVLFSCEHAYRPLEQIGLLANAEGWPGKIFEAVANSPGITPGELANKFGIENNHVSNVIKKLNDEGLILRQPAGRNVHLHVVMNKQSLLVRLAPLRRLLEIFDEEKQPVKLTPTAMSEDLPDFTKQSPADSRPARASAIEEEPLLIRRVAVFCLMTPRSQLSRQAGRI